MQLNTYKYISANPGKTFHFLAVVLVPLILISCSKDTAPPGTASLTIINAIVGSRPLATNFSGGGPIPYLLSNKIMYNRFTYNLGNPLSNTLSSYSGTQQLALYQYPDTTDKSIPLLNLTLDLPVGSIQTLFLTGTVNAPEAMVTKDTVPFYAASDSTMGIRFINLSPGSGPVSVNIGGNPNGSEQRSLSYKGFTGFNNYPVRANLGDYVFEFRDVATGTLIATYATVGISNPGTIERNKWVYHTFTFALLGTPGGTGADAQTVLLIQHT